MDLALLVGCVLDRGVLNILGRNTSRHQATHTMLKLLTVSQRQSWSKPHSEGRQIVFPNDNEPNTLPRKLRAAKTDGCRIENHANLSHRCQRFSPRCNECFTSFRNLALKIHFPFNSVRFERLTEQSLLKIYGRTTCNSSSAVRSGWVDF